MLKRKIYGELLSWWNTSRRKALFVIGPRQVGKSYSIEAFGKAHSSSYHKINLFENKAACKALAQARDVDDFIRRVTLFISEPLIPEESFIFIDEVQELPDVMTMAKFLVEDGRYTWAFSGSMLGADFKGVRSYPIGYVHELVMRPLDFQEFVWALGISEDALLEIDAACREECPVEEYIHDAMITNFRTYVTVGGMPEVVQEYLDTKGDFNTIRAKQVELNSQYRHDISKYAGSRALHVQSIFDQLPVQLEGKTHRYVLNSIDQNARYEKYQRDFVWLVNAGVALKTDLTNDPVLPLARTVNEAAFKLYQSDVGMLMARYSASVARAAYLGEKHPNLGGIFENAVAQELVAAGHRPFYYQKKKQGEVDFILDGPHARAVPIEVKSGSYYRAHTALDNLVANHSTDIEQAIVLCRGNVERVDKILYLPWYAVFCLDSLIGDELNTEDFKLTPVIV